MSAPRPLLALLLLLPLAAPSMAQAQVARTSRSAKAPSAKQKLSGQRVSGARKTASVRKLALLGKLHTKSSDLVQSRFLEKGKSMVVHTTEQSDGKLFSSVSTGRIFSDKMLKNGDREVKVEFVGHRNLDKTANRMKAVANRGDSEQVKKVFLKDASTQLTLTVSPSGKIKATSKGKVQVDLIVFKSGLRTMEHVLLSTERSKTTNFTTTTEYNQP